MKKSTDEQFESVADQMKAEAITISRWALAELIDTVYERAYDDGQRAFINAQVKDGWSEYKSPNEDWINKKLNEINTDEQYREAEERANS